MSKQKKRIGLFIGWTVSAALQFCCSTPARSAGIPISPPTAGTGKPTVVYVSMALLDIDEISSEKQNFTANLAILARWNDPRLAFDGTGSRFYALSEIWHPRLQFINQQKIWPTFPETLEVKPDGRVEYLQRIWGPFSQPLDLHDFPFDTQTFEIRLVAAHHRPSDVVFKPDPESPSGLAPKFSLPDWKILHWRLDFTPYAPLTPKRAMPSFALIITAKRYVSYYVTKIIMPLVLIMFMSWVVFWIDPTEAGTQIGISTTSMLTLIAYRFMIGGKIPPVPYSTRMDVFILGSTFLVFLALLQVIITSTMAKRNRLHGARWLDRFCRVLFPALFAGIIYFSFFNPSLFETIRM